MMSTARERWKNGIIQTILIAYLLFALYPLMIMIITSLKTTPEIMKDPLGLPAKLNLAGYERVLGDPNFGLYIQNSLLVSLTSIILAVLVSLTLSYALARYKFKFVNFIFIYFLLGMMIPMRLGIIYINELMYTLGLLDSLYGLILLYTAMSIPFSMFILTGFIKMIPNELDESAYMDGCSEPRIISKIILPLLKPALATVLIYNFIPIWNDVYFPLIFLHSPENKTLMLFITIFFGQFSTDWSLVFSALTIGAIPSIIIYLVGSKYFIKGLTSGALKG